jgi:hypothetical protein
MAPVHLYLASWVLGGVLLGASMLLDAREPETPDEAAGSPDPSLGAGALAGAREAGLLGASALPHAAASGKVRRLLARSARLLPLGLIGFGLSGLLAKGFDLDMWPWTPVAALAVGLSLIALGFRLSRARLR